MLTKKQIRTLNYLLTYMDENAGKTPSYRDICVDLGFSSTSAAFSAISRLEERGFVRRLRGNNTARSFSIEVIRRPPVQYFVFDERQKRLRPALVEQAA